MEEAPQGITYEVLDETAARNATDRTRIFFERCVRDKAFGRAFERNPHEFWDENSALADDFDRAFDRAKLVLRDISTLVRCIIKELFPEQDLKDDRFRNFDLDEEKVFELFFKAGFFPPYSIAHFLARDHESKRAVGHLEVAVCPLPDNPSKPPDSENPVWGGYLAQAFVDPACRERGVFHGLMERGIDFVRTHMLALEGGEGVSVDTFRVGLNAHRSQSTYPFLAGPNGVFERYGFKSMGSFGREDKRWAPIVDQLEFFEATFLLRPNA